MQATSPLNESIKRHKSEGQIRFLSKQVKKTKVVFALMKLGDWLKAEQAVCDVLGVAPDDEKALYRAAKIALHLSKWAEADAAILRGRSLYPASPAFPRLESALKTQRAKYKERRKQMSRSMAGALFAVDGAVDEAPDAGPHPPGSAAALLTPSTVSAPALDVIEPADHNEDVIEPAVIAAVLLTPAAHSVASAQS